MKIENDEGKEIEVFTAEEVETQRTEAVKAREAEIMAETGKTLAEKEAEIDRLKKVNIEKTENFRKYNEMTAEERAAHSENELALIKKTDQLTEELSKTSKTLEEKLIADKAAIKNSTLKTLHHDLPEVKEKLEKNYDILSGMPETTPEEINARVAAAARLSGITVDARNPLYQSVTGESPTFKETDTYVETKEGKEAASLVRNAMGLPEEKK